VDPSLAGDLDNIRYPLHLIDFETVKWVVPSLPNSSAHLSIPFQWSCHILEAPGATPEHREFLYRGGDDPRSEFASTLLECVRPAATVGIYTHYELTVINELVNQGVPHADELRQILAERVLDLKKMVEARVYLREFKGSLSLKSVLPALSFGHGYDDLRIRDGEAASAEYKRMCAVTTRQEDAEQIAQDLLAYCKRDTEAMVVLLDALRNLVQPGAPVATSAEPEPDDLIHEQLALNL